MARSIQSSWVSNQSYTKQATRLENPFEILQRALNPDTLKQPNIAHLQVYGCRAYPLRYKIPHKRKLEPRAHIGYLVRQTSSASGFQAKRESLLHEISRSKKRHSTTRRSLI